MKYELHCHSWYSKGRKIRWECMMPPEQIVRVLKEKGFGGVAITDHDSVKSWPGAKKAAKKYDMVFIPGIEISSSAGHVIGLGLSEGIRPGQTLEETLDAIHGQGGIAVAPHPFDLKGEGIGEGFIKCDAAEIFNSLNSSRLENIKAERKIRKAGIPAVGGSDAHSFGMLGRTINVIDAHDMDSASREIKKGRVRVHGTYTPVPVIVAWVRERMTWSYDDIIKYIEKNYSPPRRKLARFMLDWFINSDSKAWDALGYFSIGTSVVYSALRTIYSA